MAEHKPLALSMGEPSGIGPDLILRLYAERDRHGLPTLCVFGHLEFLKARAARLGLEIAIEPCAPAGAAGLFPRALPVVPVEGMVADHPGKPSPVAARMVVGAIREAVAATLRGTCRGLVTAPIHKAVLGHAGFSHPGHTEFLAALCANGGPPQRAVMMLAHGRLRAVPLTIHVPLRDVPRLVTAAALTETVRIVSHDLKQRFGIAAPRIAIAGLNPHAGESGTMGMEELDIIGPAISGLRQEGLDVVGPLPADTLFYPPHWERYDVVVAMYHDQALVPIKTVAFEDAVNLTLGLPIVRTSPDHGTALDLAGSGGGSVRSMLAAIRLADEMTRGQDQK